MAKSTVSETLARPARTLGQLGAAAVLVEFYASFVSDLTERQYGALLGLLTLVLGALQITLENRAGVAVLRKVPPRKVPLKDDKGEAETFLIGLFLIVVGIVIVVSLAGLLWTVIGAVVGVIGLLVLLRGRTYR